MDKDCGIQFQLDSGDIAGHGCLGLWPGILKLSTAQVSDNWRGDYATGFVFASLVVGLTAGNFAATQTLLENASRAASTNALYAVCGGAIFYIGNLLLVRSITRSGSTLAFPVASGAGSAVAAAVDVALGSTPVIPLPYCLLSIAAAGAAILAHRPRLNSATVTFGVLYAVLAGLLVGTSFLVTARALQGLRSLNSYSVSAAFAIGLFVCALLANVLSREPTSTPDRDPKNANKAGIVAGIITGLGITLAIIISGFVRATAIAGKISFGFVSRALTPGPRRVPGIIACAIWPSVSIRDSRGGLERGLHETDDRPRGLGRGIRPPIIPGSSICGGSGLAGTITHLRSGPGASFAGCRYLS